MESGRRPGVLVILPGHRRTITALPGELRQQQNRGGRMEGRKKYMINKDAANALFERNACLVVDRDVIPEKIAIELTSREAVEFAKKNESSAYNGYGIGEIGTMSYLNRRGFFLALTYLNVRQELETEVDHERKD